MIEERVEAYLRVTKMAPSRLGREALNDPNFVFNLLQGRRPRRKTIARLLAFIQRHDGGAVQG